MLVVVSYCRLQVHRYRALLTIINWQIPCGDVLHVELRVQHTPHLKINTQLFLRITCKYIDISTLYAFKGKSTSHKPKYTHIH